MILFNETEPIPRRDARPAIDATPSVAVGACSQRAIRHSHRPNPATLTTHGDAPAFLLANYAKCHRGTPVSSNGSLRRAIQERQVQRDNWLTTQRTMAQLIYA
jgi:hypothetical protein